MAENVEIDHHAHFADGKTEGLSVEKWFSNATAGGCQRWDRTQVHSTTFCDQPSEQRIDQAVIAVEESEGLPAPSPCLDPPQVPKDRFPSFYSPSVLPEA